MQSKFTKTEPLKQLNLYKKQYFDINKNKLSCFIRKDITNKNSITNQKYQNHIQLKQPPLNKTITHIRNKEDTTEDSPEIALIVANDIIAKIERHGLEFQQSDDESLENYQRKSLSPTGNQFSSNNIWKKDWSTHSIDKSFISSSRKHSCKSFQKQLSNQFLSTHRSSNTSYSNYQEPFYSNQRFNSFYYQRPVIFNSFEIVFDRILTDGRTTMMIKNIPNKYSIAVLGDEIDTTHENEYDFLYLPFDQNSKCNMGYAFINFVTTQSLKKFYQLYNLRKWTKYKSQKICQLTYARLQGKASLVDHFHSSKVYHQKGKNGRPVFRDFTQIKEIIAKQKSSSLNETYIPTYF